MQSPKCEAAATQLGDRGRYACVRLAHVPRTLTIVKPSRSGCPRFCTTCSYMLALALYALIAHAATLPLYASMGRQSLRIAARHHLHIDLRVSLPELRVVRLDRGRGERRRAVVRHAIVVVGDFAKQLVDVLGRPRRRDHLDHRRLAALTALTAVRFASSLAATWRVL